MTTDPAASMRVWAVELNLAGRTFEIPPLPAADWLPLLMEGEISAVLDLIEDPDPLDEMILSGQAEPADLSASVTMAVEQVAGRSVHQALTLARVAHMEWAVVGGELARLGVRWDEIPLGAALDAIHSTVLAHLKPEGQEKFRALLDNEDAPAGDTGPRLRRRPNRDRAMAQFEEMAGPKPAPVPVKATAGQSGGARPRTRQQPRQRPRSGR
jgi:hypothetical protein